MDHTGRNRGSLSLFLFIAGLTGLILASLTICAEATAAGSEQSPIDETVEFIDARIEELADVHTRREVATRPTIILYIVQEGDTVSGIARRFGLTMDTIRWSNPFLERNPDYLRPGMEIIILPVPGVYHQVVVGETLEQLASRYGVAPETILEYPLNHLSPGEPLTIGEWLVIPYGTKTLNRPKPALDWDYPFAWPIVGSITQGYSASHRAIDIGAPYGSKVYAAGKGKVVHAAWATTGYGYTVIVEHGEGFQTLYSHLKGTWVTAGQKVNRGDLIGEVGSTGNSSGPHVHFEIRSNGARVNPLNYLSPR